MCQFPSLTFIVIIIVIIFIVIIFWAHLTAMKGQIFTQHFKWFQNQHLHINLLLLLQKTCECVSYWGQLIHKNAEFPSQGQTGKESKAELLSLQRALSGQSRLSGPFWRREQNQEWPGASQIFRGLPGQTPSPHSELPAHTILCEERKS
jgi:hypothetical protein